MSSSTDPTEYYSYNPNKVLPAVFAALVGASFGLHISQNFRYRYWRVTFFMVWAGAIFEAGWIVRTFSINRPTNLGLYVAQYMLIYMAPPVYSAAEYNILGRLMHYLPMHAPFHPGRVVYFFVYLGAAVEVLTALGAAELSSAAQNDTAPLKRGASLLAAGVILQGVVELLFVSLVGLIHRRCAKAGMLTRNVTIVCITLYGTSALVLLRCVFRAVEKFNILNVVSSGKCDGACDDILSTEWYLYAFEGAPMVLYTIWLNIVHPGRFLPSSSKRYLDYNKVERIGPGWNDNRPKLNSLLDPLNFEALIKREPSHQKFWLDAEQWPVAGDGSFAKGTASNVQGKCVKVGDVKYDKILPQ
ncbi:hypothetical protein OHC33_002596 [Knufia fluminis]|uniref:RTA1 domain protein n=1 Tax=Knufia fluminis TaxID=191047 RepID=A0AAN8F3T0_9EURO|nr:hypothetical protein OHC33_002596 [Knufia fluminis]